MVKLLPDACVLLAVILLSPLLRIWIPDNPHGDGQTLRVSVINFRSIMSKKVDLLQFIATHQPHIIIGTEIWLSPDISNNEIIPNDFNYNIYRNDRQDGYGGMMLAISNH